jgi:hypothetical protein
MNFLDALIVLALIAVFGALFFAGLWRALSALVALWVGLIGADLFGRAIGSLLEEFIPGIEIWTARALGFLLAFIIVATLIMYLALRSFRTLSARSGRSFEVRGGFPVLFATIVLAGVVALGTVTVVVQVSARTIEDLPQDETPGFAVRQYEGAALRPATERISSYVYNATGSWVPGGAPSVLNPED